MHLEVQAKELVCLKSHWILEAKETSYHPIRAQWLRMHPGVSSTSSAEVAEVEDEVGREQKSPEMPRIIRMSRVPKEENTFRCCLVTYSLRRRFLSGNIL